MSTDLQASPLALEYGIHADRLPPALAANFRQSAPDAALEHFLSRAAGERAGALKTFAFVGLQRLMSDYDAYGMLRMYRMHLLGTEAFCKLLDRRAGELRGALLDVGAGDGGVTRFARPLFQRVVVTESSRALQRALARHGFARVAHDLGCAPWPSAERFEVVSLLNVLDRTSRPRSLLAHARAALAPGGRLLISVPLPLHPCVYEGSRTLQPEEPLPDATDTFEQGAQSLVHEVLSPAQLAVERWTRLPYVSHGDSRKPLYVLDAAVFVCSAY